MQRDRYLKFWSGSWKGFILLICGMGILTTRSLGQRAETLVLVQKIPLPEITGRIDHMALDSKRDRLLVAALASHRLEIVNLKTN